ncbi:hypothetical protein AX774_g5913 [Zancudomyces culisetae]|uniref:CCHC-type domain-containing protein n=1 Tax=Zancudomyces culisetae TaxID=1213189 RepID=A0A1R1PI70_ZANCU|nr:hypothetical protein AX774_g5913 [Zancudomyces culisetae]|eukprot:OMH80647.1 hypothetical protein AX774_g5913 [Zancudomyces culisetae]
MEERLTELMLKKFDEMRVDVLNSMKESLKQRDTYPRQTAESWRDRRDLRCYNCGRDGQSTRACRQPPQPTRKDTKEAESNVLSDIKDVGYLEVEEISTIDSEVGNFDAESAEHNNHDLFIADKRRGEFYLKAQTKD